MVKSTVWVASLTIVYRGKCILRSIDRRISTFRGGSFFEFFVPELLCTFLLPSCVSTNKCPFLEEKRGKKERKGRKKGKSSSITRFDSIESKKRREEKDRWNPDSYCIESQSLTGKKIETNPSNSIRVGSRGRNNGFSLHTPWKSIFDVQFQTQYQTLRIFTTCVIKGYRILDIPG